MAGKHSKSDDALHPNDEHELNQQLLDLSNDLFKLVCMSRFYHQAFHAMILINKTEEWPLDEHAQYGLFSIGEWLHDQGNSLIQQAEKMINNKDN